MLDYRSINKLQSVSETDPFTLKRYEQFASFMKQSAHPVVLDIGCNTGRGGIILKKAVPQVRLIGIDIIEERLALVPEGVYDSLINASITNIPLDDCCVDFIVAGEVIEHIAKEDVEAVLAEFRRVLKPSGQLVMTTPNPNSLLVKFGKDAVLKDPSHLQVMSISKHKLLLKKSAFHDIRIFGSGRASNYFPQWFPFMSIFGSYLSVSRK